MPVSINKILTGGLVTTAVRNVKWNFISEVGGKGLYFLATLLIARSLGAESFGLFMIAQIYVMYAWLLVNLGISMYGPKQVSRASGQESWEIFCDLYTIRLVSGFTVQIIFLLMILYFIEDKETRNVFIASSFYLIFRGAYPEWYFKGKEKFDIVSKANLFVFGFLLFSVFIGVRSPDHATRAAALISTIYLIGTLVLLLHVKTVNDDWSGELKFQFSLNRQLIHLKDSVYFFASGSTSVIYQYIPILLIGSWYGNHITGQFSAAQRLIIYATFVLSTVTIAVYPLLARLHKKDSAKMNQLFNVIFILLSVVSTAVALGTFVYSTELTHFILGEDYGSGVVLKVLVFYLVLRVLRELLVIGINTVGFQSKTVFPFLLGLCVLVVLLSIFRFTWNDSAVLLSTSLACVVAEFCVFLCFVRIWVVR